LRLEWRRPEAYFEVEVGPDGQLAYLVVTGEGAERRSEEVDEANADRVLLSLTRILRVTRAA
jgi:hypothetical protein